MANAEAFGLLWGHQANEPILNQLIEVGFGIIKGALCQDGDLSDEDKRPVMTAIEEL
jgi:hypothetical protein